MQNALAMLSDAASYQQMGRYAEAEALYKAVLAVNPDHPDALTFYGALKLRLGETTAAIPLLSRAVQVRPDHVFSRFALGNALLRSGGLMAAVQAYRALLERDPDHGGAWTNLGIALRGLGDMGTALQAFKKALSVQPDLLAARSGVASIFLFRREFKAALAEAAEVLRQSPGHVEALMVAGTALQELKQFVEAEKALQHAALADPHNARARLNLANVLAEMDRYDEAIALCKAAISLEPSLEEAQANLVCLLTRANKPLEALAASDAVLRANPDDARLHWNRAVAALVAGEWELGWQEYVWRKRHPDYAGAFRVLPGPVWQGGELTGKTLLVVAEQGLGDTIQFARYLPWLAAGGAQVILSCAATLLPLMRQLPGVQAVDRDAELPEYDTWVDLLDLPGLMRARPNNIPNARGYLSPDKARVRAWRAALPEGTKVGLVWAGNPQHANDQRRSVTLEALAPILAQTDICFVNLQVGRSDPALARRSNVFDAAPALKDFGETAAVIANLDLVITVDTATAHCAAALGKPVWLMLPYTPDWRWMLGRDDTPWYASMRLFRQPSPGDWASVTQQIAMALIRHAAASSPEPDAKPDAAPAIPAPEMPKLELEGVLAKFSS